MTADLTELLRPVPTSPDNATAGVILPCPTCQGTGRLGNGLPGPAAADWACTSCGELGYIDAGAYADALNSQVTR